MADRPPPTVTAAGNISLGLSAGVSARGLFFSKVFAQYALDCGRIKRGASHELPSIAFE
jgi:hypothetical protein